LRRHCGGGGESGFGRHVFKPGKIVFNVGRSVIDCNGDVAPVEGS
jgi:hypothetical protein